MEPDKTETPPPANTSSNPPQKGVDLSKILLPNKTVHAEENAQRVSAGVLMQSEQTAGTEGIPKEPGVPPTAPAPKPAAAPESTVRSLETYSGDIEKLVKEKNISVVSIAAAEAQARGERSLDPAAEQKSRAALVQGIKRTVMICTGILLVAGAVTLVVWIYTFQTASVKINTPDTVSPLIAVDYTKVLPIDSKKFTRATVMSALDSERQNLAISLGLIERLYVTEASSTSGQATLAGVTQLLSTLAPTIPQVLLRTVDPGAYVLGLHSLDGAQAFLLLQVDSYEQAFSGMLQWESTMQRDLLPLFTRNVRPKIPQSATSTSTPPIQTTQFVDQVVLNHDTRSIRNESGDILLLWTFLDKQTLLITTSETTVREIISRFASSPITPFP